jgi:hypothetical protein
MIMPAPELHALEVRRWSSAMFEKDAINAYNWVMILSSVGAKRKMELVFLLYQSI